VRKQKIVRAAQAAEDRRQERELRKQGKLPPKQYDPNEEGDCCLNQKPPVPKGWKRNYSNTHQLLYYYCEDTQESTWRRPKEVPSNAKGLHNDPLPSYSSVTITRSSATEPATAAAPSAIAAVPSAAATTVPTCNYLGAARSPPTNATMHRPFERPDNFSVRDLSQHQSSRRKQPPKPPEPAEAPTQADRQAAVLEEVCFSIQLVFCWCFLYSAV